MSTITTRHPITCVAVFINDGNGNYLIGERRAKTVLEGVPEYCIPGGKIDWKEEPEAAAIREVLEETNLEIEITDFIGIGNDTWSNHDLHFISLYYTAKIVGGQLGEPEPHKVGGWRFIPKSKIPQLFASANTVVHKLQD